MLRRAMRPARSARIRLGVVVLGSLLLTACTSSTPIGPTPTTRTTATESTAATATSVTPSPVTPDGMLTGPGVTTTTITLGLLVDPSQDAGFSQGVRLWQRTVNTTGGVCGRLVQFAAPAVSDSAAGLSDAYREIGRDVLGLVVLPGRSGASGLLDLTAADQVPVLAPTGTASDLGPAGMTVAGPTTAIEVINGLSYLQGARHIPAGSTVAVITDGTPDASDGLAGARWWVKRSGVTLTEYRTTGEVPSAAPTVVVLAGPAVTASVLQTDPRAVVLTTVPGLPEQVSDADADRLYVTTPTPAFTSDYPQAKAVSDAYTSSGGTDPGPLLLAGYATAATWGRLLVQACKDLSLTRPGVRTAIATVGPAAVDSLFGPSDPGLPGKGQPATRVSAMAQAHPGSPTGLQGLTWLQAAPGIADYPDRG